MSSAGERKRVCRKFFCGRDFQHTAADTAGWRPAAAMHRSALWADDVISPSTHLRRECKTWGEGRVPEDRRARGAVAVVAACRVPAGSPGADS